MALLDRVPQGGEQWGAHNEQYRPAIERYAAQYNVPVQLLLNLGRQESDWRPSTVSTAGAQGLMQFMPTTTASLRRSWNWPGFDPANNTDHAIEGAARYLRQIYNQFYGDSTSGNWGPVAAGYNWGHNGTRGQTLINWNDQTLASLPPETQNYVRNTTRGLSGALGIGSDANIPLGDANIPLGNFQFIGDHWVPGAIQDNILILVTSSHQPSSICCRQHRSSPGFDAPLPFAPESSSRGKLQDWYSRSTGGRVLRVMRAGWHGSRQRGITVSRARAASSRSRRISLVYPAGSAGCWRGAAHHALMPTTGVRFEG